MAGSDYARCEECGEKAFYDADTDIGSCVVFHLECLRKREAARKFDMDAIPDDDPMIRAVRSVVGKQAPALECAMLQDLVRSLKKHVEDLPDE